jgi:hypothetical protein
MRAMTALLVTMLILSFVSVVVYASGPIGIYSIVEKVVFEPNEQAPERIQVWGAFAYADGGLIQTEKGFSAVKKGYLYFRDPTRSPTILKEWRDLKAIAGTGQAVAFGTYIYIGAFPTQPGERPPNGIYLPAGGDPIDLRVRLESEAPASPAIYASNVGLVKLPTEGSHADIVKLLKDALKR